MKGTGSNIHWLVFIRAGQNRGFYMEHVALESFIKLDYLEEGNYSPKLLIRYPGTSCAYSISAIS